MNSSSLLVITVAGTAVATTLVVSLPVGVVIGLGVAWCIVRHGKSPTSDSHPQQLQGAIHDKPLEPAIPLKDNQAYRHIRIL